MARSMTTNARRQSSVGLLRLESSRFLPRPRPVARRPGVESGLFVVRAGQVTQSVPVRASSRASTRPPESSHRGTRSNWPAPRWPLASGWRTSSPATCPPALRPLRPPFLAPATSTTLPLLFFSSGKPRLLLCTEQTMVSSSYTSGSMSSPNASIPVSYFPSIRPAALALGTVFEHVTSALVYGPLFGQTWEKVMNAVSVNILSCRLGVPRSGKIQAARRISCAGLLDMPIDAWLIVDSSRN